MTPTGEVPFTKSLQSAEQVADTQECQSIMDSITSDENKCYQKNKTVLWQRNRVLCETLNRTFGEGFTSEGYWSRSAEEKRPDHVPHPRGNVSWHSLSGGDLAKADGESASTQKLLIQELSVRV